jgi:hypothetical protein
MGIAAMGAAQAQTDPPRGTVRLQATVKGPVPAILTLPFEPPVLSGHPSLTGDSPLLGKVAYVDHHYANTTPDGVPVFAKGRAVLSGERGNALFFEWATQIRGTATGGVLQISENKGTFVITGGRGRYVGATGSGTISIDTDFASNQLVFTFDGMVTPGK